MSDERASRGVALFGGTFDPPHIGHVTVARDAFEALSVRRVVWIPCGHPPHKLPSRLTSPELRLEMTRAAVANDERFRVSDVEVRREGVSYTVDTVREAVGAASGTRPFLLIGPDQAAAFRGWREPGEIARLARLVVMVPGDGAYGRVPSPGVEHTELPVTRVDISSTQLRARVREGRPLRRLVPEAVRAIVEREGLYRGAKRGQVPAMGVASGAVGGAGRRRVSLRQPGWTDR